MRIVKLFGTQSVRVFLALFFLLGCARVNLTSKEPIKLDVTMRVDVYQHVSRDADAIEDMISSGSKIPGPSSWLSFGVNQAYAAEEDYPDYVLKAIQARKDRHSSLAVLESQGIVGENARGFVEIRDALRISSSASALVSQENTDRSTIYDYVATKNGASSFETGKVFAERIQSDAPAGTPVQDSGGNWRTK